VALKFSEYTSSGWHKGSRSTRSIPFKHQASQNTHASNNVHLPLLRTCADTVEVSERYSHQSHQNPQCEHMLVYVSCTMTVVAICTHAQTVNGNVGDRCTLGCSVASPEARGSRPTKFHGLVVNNCLFCSSLLIYSFLVAIVRYLGQSIGL
jgi:hypothetical protein